MLKFIVLIGFFFIFSLLIWAFGLSPHDDELFLKYLVFAMQLLYGNMCYDVLKSMRPIPQDHHFWNSAVRIAGEATVCMGVAIGLLVIAFKVFFLAYVGIIGSLVCYSYIFVRVLPRLQPLYVEATKDASSISTTNKNS